MSEPCACGSADSFAACCGPLLAGVRNAATAEALMRSRYVAYVKRDVDYLVRTTDPDARSPNLARSIQTWMDQLRWTRLHVLSASETRVEFVAEYVANGVADRLHERSEFKRHGGEWFYAGEE